MLKGAYERVFDSSSHVYVYVAVTRKMEEKLNQQEVEQQVQESQNRRNPDIKRLSEENSGAPHQPRADEKTTGAEIKETVCG